MQGNVGCFSMTLLSHSHPIPRCGGHKSGVFLFLYLSSTPCYCIGGSSGVVGKVSVKSTDPTGLWPLKDYLIPITDRVKKTQDSLLSCQTPLALCPKLLNLFLPPPFPLIPLEVPTMPLSHAILMAVLKGWVFSLSESHIIFLSYGHTLPIPFLPCDLHPLFIFSIFLRVLLTLLHTHPWKRTRKRTSEAQHFTRALSLQGELAQKTRSSW